MEQPLRSKEEYCHRPLQMVIDLGDTLLVLEVARGAYTTYEKLRTALLRRLDGHAAITHDTDTRLLRIDGLYL